ncbi:MAG TPA: hypothetical protein VFB19_05935 [Mycobacterium sp.]|nr:hypothetical protein [Mycobacterium sp.]
MTRPTGPGHATMPTRGWLVLAGVAAVVVAVIVGVLVANGSPSVQKTAASAAPAPAAAPPPKPTSLPDLGGPHSQLVPELSLPVGARPYTGKTPTPPGFEYWEVPGSHQELVAQMRSELPTFKPLNGMPWCGELNDNMTSWAWGNADDTIGVSLIDGGVMITRLPEPHGCHP